MSLELHVLLASLPDREGWQASIDAAGFELRLDPELVVESDTGFVPCTIGTKQSGFELWREESAELARSYLSLAGHAAARPHAITLRWGGDMLECACALAAAAGMAHGLGGVAYYPDDDLTYEVEDLLGEAREAIAAACD